METLKKSETCLTLTIKKPGLLSAVFINNIGHILHVVLVFEQVCVCWVISIVIRVY